MQENYFFKQEIIQSNGDAWPIVNISPKKKKKHIPLDLVIKSFSKIAPTSWGSITAGMPIWTSGSSSSQTILKSSVRQTAEFFVTAIYFHLINLLNHCFFFFFLKSNNNNPSSHYNNRDLFMYLLLFFPLKTCTVVLNILTQGEN